MEEHEKAKLPHIQKVNQQYVGHDAEFNTQKLNPFLWKQLLDQTDYLTAEKREQLHGLEGFLTKGFPVEGEVPVYGAWDGI
eukprot:g5607.t1